MTSRRTELDALRGLLLVIMAITHLPTRLRSYSDQPLGFVSAAEGFVFLSAFVAGKTYSLWRLERGVHYARSRLWSRAFTLYGYHLALLGFAFTIIATLAAASARPGLTGLLGFYFDRPGMALLGGPLLLYQPPLLDILPMYIVFLLLSPLVFEWTERRGWVTVLGASLLVWTFAQLGGRRLVHTLLCDVTGFALPLEAAGAFDLLAWQLLWIGGLWCGVARPSASEWLARSRASEWLALPALVVAVVFCCLRHRIGGLSVELDAERWLGKWHLGPLRMVNFAALALLFARVVLPALGWLRIRALSLIGRALSLPGRALSLLGRASLQVFTAHLLLCLLSLGLVADENTPLSSLEEAGVLLATFGSMLFVAWRASVAQASRRYGFSA